MLFCLIEIGNVRSQETEIALTLRECIQIALNHNHTLKQAIYDVDIARARLYETRSDLLPQVNASANLTNNISIPVVMLPGELIGQQGTIPVEMVMPYEGAASVEMSQVIFSASLFTGISSARNASELAVLRSLYTHEEGIYNVGNAFYDILHTEQQMASIRSNLNMQNTLYQRTRRRVEQELTRDIDLQRIQVGIKSLEVKSAQLQTLYSQQMSYFNILLGLPLNIRLKLDSTSFHSMPSPAEVIGGLNPESRTEMLLLDKQHHLLKLNRKQVNSQYLPTLAFVASGGYQFQSERFKLNKSESWYDYSMIGIRLSIPIFDGLRKHRQSQQTNFEIRKLEEEKEETHKTLLATHVNAMLQLEQNYSSVAMQEENLALARKVYEQAQLLYKEGLFSITDLLQTETAYQDAQTAYNAEVISYQKAVIEMRKAEGTLFNLVEIK